MHYVKDNDWVQNVYDIYLYKGVIIIADYEHSRNA